MEEIAWNETFSVGVLRLDEQHKRIIGVVNHLIRNADATVDSEVISEALTRLTDYAKNHFKDEEELLVKHGYPDSDAHLRAHREYRRAIVSFCQDTWEQKSAVPGEIIRFVRKWWLDHILGVDMGYREFFKTRGVS
jgi:hemerythrin-like metal-binding protein